MITASIVCSSANLPLPLCHYQHQHIPQNGIHSSSFKFQVYFVAQQEKGHLGSHHPEVVNYCFIADLLLSHINLQYLKD